MADCVLFLFVHPDHMKRGQDIIISIAISVAAMAVFKVVVEPRLPSSSSSSQTWF